LNDPATFNPNAFVSSLAGGSTANVISANLAPGMVGVYEVRLALGLGTPASPLTQLTISQWIYTSNIVTIPVVTPDVQNPVPATPSAPATPDPVGDTTPPTPAPSAAPLSIKSSASFAAGSVAPNMIGFAEAPGIASSLVTAPSGSWPTTLSGVSIVITDSQGQKLQAPIYFVAPTSIGFLVPGNTALGQATIKATTSTTVFAGTLTVNRIAPGLYTANSSGSGVAAGLFVLAPASGTQTSGLLFTPATRAAVPVGLGSSSDQVFLSLYGTGFRSAGAATATVGGVSVPVSAFAPVTQYQGLDVVNVGPLPRSFAGRGEVSVALSFDGQPANTVTATIQ
jgi:uncharacterized protein (TIGR03437 family)